MPKLNPDAERSKGHTARVRDRIRTQALVNRLTRFCLGMPDPATKKLIDLSPAQVTGILGILKKSLPDLQSIEHMGEIEQKHVIIADKPLTDDEWANEFCEPDTPRPN